MLPRENLVGGMIITKVGKCIGECWLDDDEKNKFNRSHIITIITSFQQLCQRPKESILKLFPYQFYTSECDGIIVTFIEKLANHSNMSVLNYQQHKINTYNQNKMHMESIKLKLIQCSAMFHSQYGNRIPAWIDSQEKAADEAQSSFVFQYDKAQQEDNEDDDVNDYIDTITPFLHTIMRPLMKIPPYPFYFVNRLIRHHQITKLMITMEPDHQPTATLINPNNYNHPSLNEFQPNWPIVQLILHHYRTTILSTIKSPESVKKEHLVIYEHATLIFCCSPCFLIEGTFLWESPCPFIMIFALRRDSLSLPSRPPLSFLLSTAEDERLHIAQYPIEDILPIMIIESILSTVQHIAQSFIKTSLSSNGPRLPQAPPGKPSSSRPRPPPGKPSKRGARRPNITPSSNILPPPNKPSKTSLIGIVPPPQKPSFRRRYH